MTLVQNRLQQLNGNNILIFLFLIASISSCSSKKISQISKTEYIEVGGNLKKNNNNKSVEVVEINTAPIKKADSILTQPVEFNISKEQFNKESNSNLLTNDLTKDTKHPYNIAVILPFYLDQIPLGKYIDDSTKLLSNDSKNAVEFYLGCQMAKEKFANKDLQVNVYFVDNKNDSLSSIHLFNNKPFPNVDYIVGPIGYKNLKTITDIAKNKQIVTISPFANSMYIQNNPYYFNANASLLSEYNELLNQYSNNNNNNNSILEIIYDGNDKTAENINLLKQLLSEKYVHLTPKFHSFSGIEDISKKLSQTDTLSKRSFIIYSSKDTYIKTVIPKLKSIKNHLSIYCTSIAMQPKLLNGLKTTHFIYSVSPYNTENLNYKIFEQQYEEKYAKAPTEVAHQAYDLLLRLLNNINKNQALTDNTSSYSLDFDNTQSKFNFQPILNNQGEINYYDNTNLYLYKWVNGSFVLDVQ